MAREVKAVGGEAIKWKTVVDESTSMLQGKQDEIDGLQNELVFIFSYQQVLCKKYT